MAMTASEKKLNRSSPDSGSSSGSDPSAASEGSGRCTARVWHGGRPGSRRSTCRAIRVRTPCPLPFRGWTSRDGWTEGRLASLSVLSSFVLHYLPVSAICRDVFIPPADCDISPQTWLFFCPSCGLSAVGVGLHRVPSRNRVTPLGDIEAFALRGAW